MTKRNLGIPFANDYLWKYACNIDDEMRQQVIIFCLIFDYGIYENNVDAQFDPSIKIVLK